MDVLSKSGIAEFFFEPSLLRKKSRGQSVARGLIAVVYVEGYDVRLSLKDFYLSLLRAVKK